MDSQYVLAAVVIAAFVAFMVIKIRSRKKPKSSGGTPGGEVDGGGTRPRNMEER